MNYILLIPLAAIMLIPRERSPACACCASRGTWYEGTSELTSAETGEINRIVFDRVARPVLTEADGQLSSTYTLSHARNGRRWEFSFRDARGNTSSLSLVLPRTATLFKADLHDGRTGGGGGPLLYKELRLEGATTASGTFRRELGDRPRIRLVLQGRGNNCLRAEDFRNWTLQVSGNRMSYSFFGLLNTPNAR